ncbi:unnamed protein product [Symbiodinium sp. CCMP2592]|nr:unnamed protein product [Symbiodinium sp. CCMP2592]
MAMAGEGPDSSFVSDETATAEASSDRRLPASPDAREMSEIRVQRSIRASTALLLEEIKGLSSELRGCRPLPEGRSRHDQLVKAQQRAIDSSRAALRDTLEVVEVSRRLADSHRRTSADKERLELLLRKAQAEVRKWKAAKCQDSKIAELTAEKEELQRLLHQAQAEVRKWKAAKCQDSKIAELTAEKEELQRLLHQAQAEVRNWKAAKCQAEKNLQELLEGRGPDV